VCGRTTSTASRDSLAQLLDVDEVDAPELPVSWNVAPTQPVYSVRTRSSGARKLEALRWGLVPRWANDTRIGAKLINARSETLSDKPAFRSLLMSHRVLLPFSGFYEWRRPRYGPGKRSQPFYFHRSDGQPLVFAGLWDLWLGPEDQPLRSCTIITTKANVTMAPVHHRMPVILPRRAWDEWTRPGAIGPQRLERLLVPAPDDLLVAHPVGPGVNNANHNGVELVAPVPPACEDAVLFPEGG
jgi:putative SOS response-associated peptidase YedK